ncbi:FlhC family transcriptional regulator [Roseateles flavus]|uniref:FlhC family transcriptional regulator n=1 Tax=Roseateles flavus TaxID=3149041 RepID=A0ABV0GKM3_9BURK
MPIERNLVHAQRHIRTLALATACAEMGARLRTIQLLTGLAPSHLQRLFRQPLEGPRRGRHPDSREWYHTANLLCRTEASIVVALYRRLASRGIDPPNALVGAYRHYLSSCRSVPRITFDRAFDLVAHTAGRWLVSSRSFSVFTCPHCHSEYLTGLSLAPTSNHECPFCKLLKRYACDPRVRAAYPLRAAPTNPQTLWIHACGPGYRCRS